MRRRYKLSFFALLPLMAACSYTSSFVVVNQSEQLIEVRYKVATVSQATPLGLVGEPVKMAAAALVMGSSEWRALDHNEYMLGAERTVTVPVLPHEALRVMRITNYRSGGPFYIEEVVIKSEGGEVSYGGQELREKFVEQSANLYILTYK